ncbi:MAG TPA: nicotinate-nucleotide adenylyltransferase [Ktedonobacterales bacterium]
MQGRVRYGILGGTFDPPHLGHAILAQEVYARLALDRVWFIPTGMPPHKQGARVTPAAQRLAMVELAVAEDERFAVSSIELELAGPSYTVETLRALRARWGDSVALYFIVGWDMLLYLPQWHDAPGVLAQLDALVALHRPGFETEAEGLAQVQARVPGLAEKLLLLPVPQVEISSSAIRERVVQGLPIRYLVLDAVRTYIEEHGLYRTVPSGKPAGSG